MDQIPSQQDEFQKESFSNFDLFSPNRGPRREHNFQAPKTPSFKEILSITYLEADQGCK